MSVFGGRKRKSLFFIGVVSDVLAKFSANSSPDCTIAARASAHWCTICSSTYGCWFLRRRVEYQIPYNLIVYVSMIHLSSFSIVGEMSIYSCLISCDWSLKFHTGRCLINIAIVCYTLILISSCHLCSSVINAVSNAAGCKATLPLNLKWSPSML